jgi:cyclopropane-fatty-acyl-phospholipid synthase
MSGELSEAMQQPEERPPHRDGLVGGLIVRIAEKIIPRNLKGSLLITLPSGRKVLVGTPGTGHDADLTLHNFKVVWAGMRRAQLGFFESYMDGHVDSTEPAAFMRFYLDNRPAIDGAGTGLFFPSWFDKLWHKRRDNTKTGARRNIAAHYDLGNDFYKLWLDETMTYSSALFDGAGNSLEAAQRRKYQRVIEMLEVKQGDSILEIGSGWGGFAEEAGRAGARVRGITLSSEQLAYARERIEKAGLAERCDFHLEDYRDTRGVFDRIASIEMIEAVGEAHWPSYFRTLFERLKPGGIAAIQGITIRESNYDSYRNGVDFIQRYIFPGGMLLTKQILKQQAEMAGLVLERVENFGQHYATTLRMWRDRFEAAWPEVAKLGFDERFRRMWRLYLAYCEAGFAEKIVDVGIYRFRKAA